MADSITLQRDEGKAIWAGGHLLWIKVSGQDSGGAYCLIELLSSPGYSPPLHSHANEDEAIYVLDGDFSMTIGGRTFSASAGSFVFIPKGTAHGYKVEGLKMARILELFSPAGFEKFFEELGEPAQELNLPPAAPIDMDKVAALARKYEMTILAPPSAH